MMKLCNQHSQKRSMYIGKGHFYWVDEASREQPLPPETTTIAATKDGYPEAYSKGKIKKSCKPSSLSHANIQTIQEVFMPPEAQALVIRFSMTVKAHSGKLHRCDSPNMRDVIFRLAQAYEKVGGYRVLARRYLENVLLGKWLWENQDSLGTEICLTDCYTKDQLVVDHVERRRWNADLSDLEEAINPWVDRYERGLTSQPDYCSFVVEAKIKLPFSAEVWPSQTFDEEGSKSKLLATYNLDGEEQVIFTRHKLGAAIHEIDDWYPGADSRKKVSTYGADRDNFTAHRHPDTGKDFFSLLKKVDQFTELLEAGTDIDPAVMDDIHFLMACLVCGGMHQESKKK
ncbi:type I-F CRISPR-associated protein Csy3 [Endozoicomonadaceae bacterium StTr2]